MRILAFNPAAPNWGYENLLYVFNTTEYNPLNPSNKPHGDHCEQGFSWEPNSAAFFVFPDTYNYAIECWVENEVQLSKNALRAIQIPFSVNEQGITLRIGWYRNETKPVWFYVPPGEYTLIFEMGYQPGEGSRLCNEVMEQFSLEFESDPEVQEYKRQQREIAVANLHEDGGGGWFQIPVIPDYDERLQRWVAANKAKIFELTGGDGYETVGIPCWIKLWFKQHANAEPKILIKDKLLHTKDTLILGGEGYGNEPYKVETVIFTPIHDGDLQTSFNSRLPYCSDSISLCDIHVERENTHNDDGGVGRLQGFSWRSDCAAFYTGGLVDNQPLRIPLHVEILITTNICLKNNSVRAIQIPFTVNEGGVIIDFMLDPIEWYFKPRRLLPVPAGEYRVVFELGYQDVSSQNDNADSVTPLWCRLSFKPEANAEAKILKQDEHLNPPNPLRLDAKPYESISYSMEDTENGYPTDQTIPTERD